MLGLLLLTAYYRSKRDISRVHSQQAKAARFTGNTLTSYYDTEIFIRYGSFGPIGLCCRSSDDGKPSDFG